MKTNFFQTIISLQLTGNWSINIARESAEILIVSVLFFNDAIGDDARKKVPPILLKGTAQELDNGFFEAIENPLKETAELFSNMEQFLKAKEQAKINSQVEKDKALQQDRAKSEKQKKYEESMKKVEALEAEGKFREAWMKVPQPDSYPEYAEAIHKRRMELSQQFEPDLFNETKI
ncbi:prtrc system protein e [Flavobacterium sp. MAHUQ-51]|uniref:prtrc system protein e n=1 Tax=Flavobacterium sp. GCM10022190 TaxID=3252639 RepID=UPI00360E0968